jgi:hypothetical protein
MGKPSKKKIAEQMADVCLHCAFFQNTCRQVA